jgi:hypothetical protein
MGVCGDSLNRDFSMWGELSFMYRLLNREFSMWGETEVPVEI